jgi:signal transduction histidine kinase
MKSRQVVRLTAPILALSILPLGVGIVTAWNVHRSHKEVSRTLALNVGSMRAAEELAIAARDARIQLERYLLTGDRAHLRELFNSREDAGRWLVQAEQTAVTPREQELVAQLHMGYDRFLDGFPDDVFRYPQERVLAEVREQIELANEITRPAQAFLDYNEEEITQSTEQNEHMASRMALVLLVMGVCGPVAGLSAGFGLARGISRSMVRLSVPIQDAAGKLSQVVGPLTLDAGSDFDGLEAVLRRIANQIGAVIERLHQSQRDALRAEQLAGLGQLAAGIAHELRNPLMSMKILVQSAAEQGESACLGPRDLGVLEEEITRLEHLTRSFLDFARPPQLEERSFDACTVLEEATALVGAQARQRGVHIGCDLPDRPVMVRADQGQLRQVLLNLLLNALEAVSNGGAVTLRLQITPGSASRCGKPHWLTLSVLDNGPGLPAGREGDIFLPFVSTKPTGIGLGLSICKRIAEAHRGEITAANRPEGGAEFRVRLPCVEISH